MSTRLDRLFQILENSSSSSVRSVAAEQLGDVIKLHPQQFPALLQRLLPLLRNQAWEIRVSTGQALNSIISAYKSQEELAEKSEEIDFTKEFTFTFSFSSLNIDTLMQTGVPLVSIGDDDDAMEDVQDANSNDLRERLKQHREKLKSLLGGGASSVIDSSDLMDENDLISTKNTMTSPQISTDIVEEEQRSDVKLSKRELHALKRKRKQQDKVGSKSRVIISKNSKTAPPQTANAPNVSEIGSNSSHEYQIANHQYALEFLTHQKLLVDIFSPKWEVRHGAAIALREIAICYGDVFGKNTNYRNQLLEDAIVRLLYVCILDRFNDFISDQTIAPVRETLAQAIGALVMRVEDETLIDQTFNSLIYMIFQPHNQPIWQVRHAGLLGLKYVVAAKENELAEKWMADTLNAVLLGLSDKDDDVISVAAAVLIPVMKKFALTIPDLLAQVVQSLWSCVENIRDDLAVSTAIVFNFLDKLFKLPESSRILDLAFGGSIPVEKIAQSLYPFFRHPVTSVRRASVCLIQTLVGMEIGNWIESKLMRLLFQNLLMEINMDISMCTFELWHGIVDKNCFQDIVQVSMIATEILLTLLINPVGQPLPTSLLLFRRHLINDDQDTRIIARKGDDAQRQWHDIDTAMIQQDLGIVSRECVLECRILSARAFGKLLHIFPFNNLESIFTGKLSAMISSKTAFERQICSFIIKEFALSLPPTQELEILMGKFWETTFLSLEQSPPQYAELTSQLLTLRYRMVTFLNGVSSIDTNKQFDKVLIPMFNAEASNGEKFDLAFVEYFETQICPELATHLNGQAELAEELISLKCEIKRFKQVQEEIEVTTSSLVAGVVISLKRLPTKINTLVRSLMEAVKFEKCVIFQDQAADSLAQLAKALADGSVTDRKKLEKIITNISAIVKADVQLLVDKNNENEDDVIFRRGALKTFSCLEKLFGPDFYQKLPIIESNIRHGLALLEKNLEEENVSEVLQSMKLLEMLIPGLDHGLHLQLLEVVPQLVVALSVEWSVVRHCAAECFALICQTVGHSAIRELLGILKNMDSSDLNTRQGVMEAVAGILLHLNLFKWARKVVVKRLNEGILPYVAFLLVPVLGRMCDSEESIRLAASGCFAELVQLLPLEIGLKKLPEFNGVELEERSRQRRFIQQLTGAMPPDTLSMPVKIKAELRQYQQDGVNWLWFLNQYNLHGVLSDDMGLGKTLQCICILVADHYYRSQRGMSERSIVICPTTLVNHWADEISSFTDYLEPMVYAGSPAERRRLQAEFADYSVIIMSYEVARNDIDAISKAAWNYCVLDEGHYIRNPKAKITKAVKALKANHRLILTGTPIQNNVTELWSLFDFLLPGFLGSEKQFNDRYGRAISGSREAKHSSKEKEMGSLALDALHRQVLPFMLRRLKEDVLQDLPPKIIQDHYCELSALQRRLYEDFTKQEDDLAASVTQGEESGQAAAHIFQALQYLRRLCSHPRLAVTKIHPKFAELQGELMKPDITLAPKLVAIREILSCCDIGRTDGDSGDECFTANHRVLIFCQLKAMLDIIENDLFKKVLTGVTYLRLDGSMNATSRHTVVKKFNNDPSVDVLLLTTSVGGLGLNLTGADTVIFVEHDWNPMKDLQAMDRAHRLGQKKVVNVYRLIMRDTVESKIMSLQNFKLHIANTVVNQQNASMNVTPLVDLFEPPQSSHSKKTSEPNSSLANWMGRNGLAVMNDLQEMWDTNDYTEEFDIDQFRTNLGRQ